MFSILSRFNKNKTFIETWQKYHDYSTFIISLWATKDQFIHIMVHLDELFISLTNVMDIFVIWICLMDMFGPDRRVGYYKLYNRDDYIYIGYIWL